MPNRPHVVQPCLDEVNPMTALSARRPGPPAMSAAVDDRSQRSIVDDTTRRRFIAVLGSAGLLTACGGGGAIERPGQPADREFTHAFGTSTIPTAPQRIVTTTDQNALLPLLELGVTPVGSAGLVAEGSGERSFRRTDGFDTRGIEHIGAYGEPNAEAIAALRPDLIVGYEYDADFATVLDRIAPFVGVNVLSRRLAEALLDFGDLAGRADRARELQAGYGARIEALRATLAERHPDLTVSLLSPDAGVFYPADVGGAIATVAGDLGLTRPAAQGGIGRFSDDYGEFSLELVAQHDADVVLLTDFSGDSSDALTAEFAAQPIVAQLQAAQRGQLHIFDGSVTVGAAWARMGAFLDVLEDKLLAGGLVSTGVNA